MNKKDKLKFKNINPNEKTDFELCYNKAMINIRNLENDIQQLAASYKALQKIGDEATVPQ